MSKNYAAFVAVIASFGVCGFLLAGQGQQPSQPSINSEYLFLKELELKKVQNLYGAAHPKALDLKEEVEVLREYLAKAQPPEKDQPKVIDSPKAEIGRYSVAASAQATVLVDTKTGESWFLRPAAGGEMEWVAIKVRVMLPPPIPAEKK